MYDFLKLSLSLCSKTVELVSVKKLFIVLKILYGLVK